MQQLLEQSLKETCEALFEAQFSATGSRVTCNPPPETTDEDWLVYLPSRKAYYDFCDKLINEGFDEEGTAYAGQENTFTSYRKGQVNLITTFDGEFAENHKKATAVCKALNLMNKADRITVFEIVLYDATR